MLMCKYVLVCVCGGVWVEARGWKYIYQSLFDLFSRKIQLAALIGQQALEILLATTSWYWDYRCETLHARFLCRCWGLKSGVTLITDWLGHLCNSVLYKWTKPSLWILWRKTQTFFPGRIFTGWNHLRKNKNIWLRQTVMLLWFLIYFRTE